MKIESGNWYGRIFVDEPQITPEQYKMFFGKYQYGISFNMANAILDNRVHGNDEEIVPADELCEEAKAQIKAMITEDGDMEGTIIIEGFTLDWKWEPVITCDQTGGNVTIKDMEKHSINKILTDMLDNEAHWGEWN